LSRGDFSGAFSRYEARMRYLKFVLCLFGGLLLCNSIHAQCRGGVAGQAATSGTTAATTAGTGSAAAMAGGQSLLTGPGSWAYDVMRAYMFQRQMAQRAAMLAMQKQGARDEKLAARRSRAEQNRAQLAESRARTRAALAAKNGSPAKGQGPAYVAYRPASR
jgi:hypothetical protein